MTSYFKNILLIVLLIFGFGSRTLFWQSISHKNDKASESKEIANTGQSESEKLGMSESAMTNTSLFFNRIFSPKLNEGNLRFKNNNKVEKEHVSQFSEIFKYHTSPENPDHRCYEIVAPLAKDYNLRFNFMSLEKFTLGGSR